MYKPFEAETKLVMWSDYKNKKWYVAEDYDSDNSLEFSNYEDIIVYVKNIKGTVEIMEDSIPGFVWLDNGEVVRVDTEFGLYDNELWETWTGEKIEEYEKTRYSIYDVYSDKELL